MSQYDGGMVSQLGLGASFISIFGSLYIYFVNEDQSLGIYMYNDWSSFTKYMYGTSSSDWCALERIPH